MPDLPAALLCTARLRLLPAREELAAQVAAFRGRNARHLAPWEPPAPPGFDTEPVQRERLRQAQAEAAAGTALRWWLQQPEDPSRLLGNVGLSQIARGPFQNAMLGYALDEACQGQGLMQEALEAVIGHAFSPELKLHRIQANVRPENRRSVALLRRLGFEEEGLAREYLYIDGAWRDHLLYARRHAGYTGAPA